MKWRAMLPISTNAVALLLIFTVVPMVPVLSLQAQGPVPIQRASSSLITTEQEHLKKIIENNNAKAAEALCAKLKYYEKMVSRNARSEATVQHMRVGLLLLAEAQKIVNEVNSDEALKVYAKRLPKMGPWSALVILRGLDLSPTGIPEELLKLANRMAERSRDFRVQVAAIDFLGHHQQLESQELFFDLLNKRSSRLPVKISVLRQLAMMGDEQAVEVILRKLEKEKSGRLRFECVGAIRSISGIELLSNYKQIDNWWTQTKDNFKAVPTENRKNWFNWEVERDAAPEELVYYNIPLITDRVAFVIDQSGSMGGSATVGSTSSLENAEHLPPNANRLDVAKLALINLIHKLPRKNGFNVLYFDSELTPFNRKNPLIYASSKNKKLAYRFINQAQPRGGTNTALAMELMILTLALKEDIGTIFLLTDGAPASMISGSYTPFETPKHLLPPVKEVEPEEGDEQEQVGPVRPRGFASATYRVQQADYFSFINQGFKIRINTVGIGASGTAQFLNSIADGNDGQYRAVE